MELIQFIRTIYRYLPLLILLPLIAMLITFVFVQNREGDYRARAIISTGFLESQNGPGMDSRIDRDQLAFRYANFLQLIHSKPVLDLVSYALLVYDLENFDSPLRPHGRIISNLGAEERLNIAGRLRDQIHELESLGEHNGLGRDVHHMLLQKEYDFNSLSNMLNIHRVGQSDFVQVAVESENAQLSAYIANTLSSFFIDYYRQKQNQLLSANIQFYIDQVSEREQRLLERSGRLQSFKVENRITNLYEQTRTLAVQISNFEYLRQNELKTLNGARSLIDSVDAVLRDGGFAFTGGSAAALNTDVGIARSTLNELNRQLINARITGDDDLAIQLREQIAEERKRLYDGITNINNQSFADPRLARQQLIYQRMILSVEKENSRQAITLLDQELERLQNLTMEFASLEAILDSYVRDIDLAERDYLAMLDRLNQFRLSQQSMSAGAQISINELAEPPEYPMGSRKLIIILAAGLGSFGFAIVALFMVEYLDLTIRTPRQLAERTGKPVLGSIPFIPTEELDIAGLFREGEQLSASMRMTLSEIRQLRSNILAHVADKKLLITSSQPQTGKTLITILLAFALAKTGRKVLIVDTNTVSNDITAQFEAEPRLFDLLQQRITKEEAISETSHPNISVIGCGLSGLSLSEISLGDGLQNTFRDLGDGYDYVLIDSTIMIHENNARELIVHADSVMLIYAADENVDQPDLDVLHEIEEYDTQLAGTVLNKITEADLEHTYGSSRNGLPERILRRHTNGSDS